MRVFGRLAAALLTVFLLLPNASAETPSSLYNKGKHAEARQDYEAAYEFYKQAYDQRPQELRYRVKYERLRFLAAASHVHKGQQLRDDGKLQEALAQFEQAAQIDTSSFVAKQEAQRTREMIQSQGQGGAAAPAGQPSAEPKPDMLHKRIEEAEGPVDLAPIQDQALVMHLSGDSKMMYQTIGKLAGLNVLFDPDYQSRQMPALDLNGVTLQQALDMIALQSSTFWRPVTANTIFVASDTPAKRKQLEQNVIKTFYLSNYSQPSDLQDIVSILRQILDVQRVLPNNGAGAVIIRGTPDQVAMAEKIVEDFDKAKPEVIVEVAIMQVRRDKLRNLGFQPPTSAAIQLKPATASVTTNNTNNQNNTTNQTTTTTNNGTLTLNDFKNLNANNFQVTIPQATLDFLFSDSNSKLLQNPQIRASDGMKATLKIGDRIPVATGSFQPGIGGVGINPLVNTQFQYLDVGVNIDILPRVHANREISLKLGMDISSQTGQTNIGGIQQPIISQRKVEHDIRLREGEVSLLAGIFENTDTHSISGWPGLAQIPILKYFFGKDSVEHVENELVFVLIPHVVRGFDINEFNTKPIDVGTGNAIDLRRGVTRLPGAGGAQPPPQPPSTSPQTSVVPNGPINGRPPGESARSPVASPRPPSETTGATAAAVPQQVASGQPQSGAQPVPGATASVSGEQSSTAVAGNAGAPGNPAAASTAASVPSTTTPTGGPAALKFDPPVVTTSANGTFSVNVVLTGGRDVYSVPIQITYDPQHLQLVNITSGELLSRDNQPIALAHRDDNGLLVASATRPPGSQGVTGDGAVFTITWQAKAPGNSVLSITRPGARNSAQQPIPVMGSQMTVNVR